MFFYNVRNLLPDTTNEDTYIRFNSCGWYQKADLSVHTSRPQGRNDYQLLYIKSGAIRFEDTICGAGTLRLFTPYEPQAYKVTEIGTEYYWLHFAGTAFDQMYYNETGRYFNIGYCEPLIQFCHEIVMHYAGALEENTYYIQGRLLSTVAALPPAKKQQALDSVDNAITYINEYYTNKLSNDELAKLCGMSKYHFIRRFTQKTGKPPQNYRTQLLLSKATMMLTDTNMKIANIAASLGFDDALYFSRLFKKAYGMSPNEYRKRR